jgi:hypothetical protein
LKWKTGAAGESNSIEQKNEFRKCHTRLKFRDWPTIGNVLNVRWSWKEGQRVILVCMDSTFRKLISGKYCNVAGSARQKYWIERGTTLPSIAEVLPIARSSICVVATVGEASLSEISKGE